MSTRPLCFEALASEYGERTAFLDTACGADADLRRDVEALLAGRPRIEPSRHPPWGRRPLAAGRASGPTRSLGRSAPVGWARSTRPATRAWTAPWPSRSCRPRRGDPQRGPLRARGPRHRRAQSPEHLHAATTSATGRRDVPRHGASRRRDARDAAGEGRAAARPGADDRDGDCRRARGGPPPGRRPSGPEAGQLMLTKAGAKLLDFGLAK